MKEAAICFYPNLLAASFVDFAIDAGDFTEPGVALAMFHVENLIHGPVKVVRDVRHFLVELLPRIGSHGRQGYPGPDWPLPPSALPAPNTRPETISTSNSWPHAVHAMWCLGAPASSLILR